MLPFGLFALLSVLGLTMSSLVSDPIADDEDIDSAGDDVTDIQDPASDDLDNDDTPEPSPETLVFENDPTVTGGSGDDVFTEQTGFRETEDGKVYLTTVNLGDGDDFAQTPSGALFGENGDDTLIGTGPDSGIYGGEGNDTLFGGFGGVARGGAGDDILSRPLVNTYYDGAAQVYGEDGNDTLIMEQRVGFNWRTDEGFNSLDGGTSFYGGEGADTFELNLRIEEFEPEEGDTMPEKIFDYALNLTDFTAGEDVLIIDVEREENETGRELIRTDIIQKTDRNGNTYSIVFLNFEGTDDQPPLTARIQLADANVTEDDIVFRTV